VWWSALSSLIISSVEAAEHFASTFRALPFSLTFAGLCASKSAVVPGPHLVVSVLAGGGEVDQQEGVTALLASFWRHPDAA